MGDPLKLNAIEAAGIRTREVKAAGLSAEDARAAGFSAKEDIAFREIYLSVPVKSLMTVNKAKSHPHLADIIVDNPKLFGPDATDSDQMILTLFILYEVGRGKASYWYPYLLAMPTVTFSCFWSDDERHAT